MNVLLLSSQEPSSKILQEILAQHVLLAIAWNREELFYLLRTERYDVFLCDKDFCQGNCQEFCKEIKKYDSNLPTIVASRLADEQEWIDVLKAGCFDILGAPYSDRSILAILWNMRWPLARLSRGNLWPKWFGFHCQRS
ncbi:MAG: response regulator [Acidobacteria bacterium]|nr:response regulator [Acidobacteriota bacterium]